MKNMVVDFSELADLFSTENLAKMLEEQKRKARKQASNDEKTAGELLNPKVHVARLKYVPVKRLKILLSKLKSKKFGSSIVAVDAIEYTLDQNLNLTNRIGEKILVPKGDYFDVYVEYVLC